MSQGHHEVEHYGEPGARHAPVVSDPEHDIDARSATIWVVVGALATFLSLWLMVPIFQRVQEAERVRKIDQAPNVELDEVRAAEQVFLSGRNPTKRSIEQVLQQMADKK
ncbi:MAG: hypothetical protein JNM25_01845 [Planctomycetes bacterium]|nr:hypothetical protein [Planctomycetota bacterium]